MAKVIKTAIVATVVAVLTVATAGAILGGLPAGLTLVSVATYTFVGSVIAGGIGIMTAKGINATSGNFGTKLAGRGAQVPRQIVYGKTRVGGIIAKMDTTGDNKNKLHLSIILAGHEIEELSHVYFGDY